MKVQVSSIRLRAQQRSPLLAWQGLVIRVLVLALIVFALIALVSCNETAAIFGDEKGSTEGPPYSPPAEITLSPFSIGTVKDGGYYIDTSHLSQGYVAASARASSRLKFQVTLGDVSYNYDLPKDGTAIVCPLNMGDGTYSFSVWQNTEGNRYVELTSPAVVEDVYLESEFAPFIRPSFYCSYTSSSASVEKARELCADAENQGDVLKNVYTYIVDNIKYDTDKAVSVADATGYVPNPDSTLASGMGICFDYSSLAAAMLRSQGIPCKIMTGYVSPGNIYHAWNMVYIDGSWTTVSIDISSKTWTRIDTTFAAGGSSDFTGDGTMYTDRYTY